MTSTLPSMYKELEKCAQALEDDVRRSLEEIDSANGFSENTAALESSKDYHFKEILSQLRQIKDHIRIIADHNQSIGLLQNKINGSRIDKAYIKKQVETFQKIGAVNRREHKSIKPRETSSLKLLECWERMVEEQQNENPDGIISPPKRPSNMRKAKKIVSCTVDTFLEGPSGRCVSFDSLIEEKSESVEVITEEATSKLLGHVNIESLCQEDDNKLPIVETTGFAKEEAASKDLRDVNGESLNRENNHKLTIIETTEFIKEEPASKDLEGVNIECLNREATESDAQSPMIETINHSSSEAEEDDEDTKPRIIEVFYKTNINGGASS